MSETVSRVVSLSASRGAKWSRRVKSVGVRRPVPVGAAAKSTTVGRRARGQTGGSTRPSVSLTRSLARTLRKADLYLQPGK